MLELNRRRVCSFKALVRVQPRLLPWAAVSRTSRWVVVGMGKEAVVSRVTCTAFTRTVRRRFHRRVELFSWWESSVFLIRYVWAMTSKWVRFIWQLSLQLTDIQSAVVVACFSLHPRQTPPHQNSTWKQVFKAVLLEGRLPRLRMLWSVNSALFSRQSSRRVSSRKSSGRRKLNGEDNQSRGLRRLIIQWRRLEGRGAALHRVAARRSSSRWKDVVLSEVSDKRLLNQSSSSR